MKKRFLSLLCVITMLFTMFGTGSVLANTSASAYAATITVPTVVVEQGEGTATVSVPITVTGNMTLVSFEAALAYDTALEFTGYTEGDSLKGITPPAVENKPNPIRFAMFDYTLMGVELKTGTLATVSFTVPVNEAKEYALNLNMEVAQDTNFAYIQDTIQCVSGKIVVEEPKTPEEPKTFEVTFVADGNTVEVKTVKEGESLPVSEFPAVPAKEGYTGEWDVNEAITAATTVTAVYTQIPTPPAHTHNLAVIPGKAATCTEAGLTDGEKCTVCGEVTKAQEVIPATGHTVEVVAGKAATCTETGLTDGEKCSVCGETITAQEVIPALGHTVEVVAGKAATCTEAGLTEGEKCTVCGEITKAQETIPALGHDWSGEAVDGIKTCQNGCGATQIVLGSGEETTEVVVEEQKLADAVQVEDGYVAKMSIEEVTTTATELIKNEIARIAKVAVDAYDTIKKVVLDITINKYLESDIAYENGEAIAEATNLVEFDITIPASLRGANKVFHILRAHDGVVDDITTTPDPVTGEYIIVDQANNLIRFFAKYFSEYAIVSVDAPASSGGGGGTSRYTVKFETNADVKLSSVTVKKNGTVAEPAAITKEGFVFDGWYTDAAFTEKYDFTNKVTKSFTLYAKWNAVEVEENEWNVFEDVEENDWFYEAVKYANINGLMNGVAEAKFAPNANVTRAMFVTVLYRLENEPQVNAAAFNDVKADAWYADAVAWASANGITAGVSATRFAPDNNISREQIATMLYRYANYKKFDTTGTSDLAAFTDADSISEYAQDAFKWAVADGIMNGKTSTTLNPADNATRAEMAALLMRVIEN